MFSTNEGHSKDELEEVMRLQSVANSLSDMKEELIGDVRQGLQDISSEIDADSSRDLQMGEIQTLTDTLRNKSAGLLNSSSALESERSLELHSFSHHSQSNHSENEIPLEAINNTDSTLALDHSHYYDGLNNASIMVYQMPSGNIVPFDSLVSVPIAKPVEDKMAEAVDLPVLHNSYSSQEVYNNNTHPLYILPDVNKFKGQENEKMLISQIYSSEDPTNLFLDTRQSFVRNNKCEINITESMNADLNLATHSNFDSTIPITSEADINQFPISATYTSTDTDSEVALTLASLGNLKNDTIRENCHQQQRILDSTLNRERESDSPRQKLNSENIIRTDGNLTEIKKETRPTLILRSRKGRGSATNVQGQNQNLEEKKGVDISTEIGSKITERCKGKSLSANKASVKSRSAYPRKRQKPPLEAKVNCEPRKENLLGQLLKASKHCEPASLIPEGVVDDVIPAVGYRIMDMSNLSEMIRMMHRCSNTSSRGLIVIQEQASLREGAVSQLSIICTGCQEGAVCATSNKSHDHLFDINARVERLTKEFNVEESQVQKMLEILGIFYRPSDQNIETKGTTPEEPTEGEQGAKKRKRKKPLKAKEKNVECKVCHKKFSGINHLKSHMFMHDNLLHTCPYCQAYFKRVFNLQEHIKKHENIKYECDICHKSYTDRSTLCAHKKSFHQEAYKQECEICSKKFFHKAHYVEHLRVHTGEKPFACDICGKRYPYVNSVKKHKQSHCTVAKYKCCLCGKWFRWLFGIRQHLFQQHKLKKCDIDAQVITDVIAETFPVTSTPKKSSVVSKAQNGSGFKGMEKRDVGKASITISDRLSREEKPGTSSSETVTIAVTTSTQPFHAPRNEATICTNLNDWKKPL